MIWTQTPPTQPGYYWFYEEHRGETDIEIVECRRIVRSMYDLNVLEDGEAVTIVYFMIGAGEPGRPEEMGGGSYWMGPIPIPSKEAS